MEYINRIKKIKNERKMTNDDLAERTGIPGGTLAKILAGISESPKLSNIVAICEALNCSLDYIMYGIEENPHNYTLSEDEINVIERFRTLDDRGRETVLTVLKKEEKFSRGDAPEAPKRARILTPEPLRARLAAAYESSDNGFGKRILPLFDLPVSAGTGMLLDVETAEDITVSDNARTREADYALRISGNSMEPHYRDGDILLVQETDTIEFGELGIFMLDGNGFFKVFGGDRLYSLNPEYGDILLKDFNDVRVAGKVIGKLKKR